MIRSVARSPRAPSRGPSGLVCYKLDAPASKRMEAAFEALDTDHDGMLSLTELRPGLEAGVRGNLGLAVFSETAPHPPHCDTITAGARFGG